MISQTLRIHTHWQVAQIQSAKQNLPKSIPALSHGGQNNGQHTTANIKHSWAEGLRGFRISIQGILYLDTKTPCKPLRFILAKRCKH